MDNSPNQPFYNFVSHLSDWQICLPKRLVIVRCETSLDVVHAVDFTDQQNPAIKTSK